MPRHLPPLTRRVPSVFRRFHENIIAQSCDDQFTWFQHQLAVAPADDWVVVVGHHPASEIDVHNFVAPMEERGVSLYINGHAHTLTHYSVNGKVQCALCRTGLDCGPSHARH